MTTRASFSRSGLSRVLILLLLGVALMGIYSSLSELSITETVVDDTSGTSITGISNTNLPDTVAFRSATPAVKPAFEPITTNKATVTDKPASKPATTDTIKPSTDVPVSQAAANKPSVAAVKAITTTDAPKPVSTTVKAETNEVSIGRDNNRVLLKSITDVQGQHYVTLDLLTLEPKCGKRCLYRYYIDGPAHYSGYLGSKNDQESLSVTVHVTYSGTYSAIVYLETLGLDSAGPLRTTFPEHPYLQSWALLPKAYTQAQADKITFLGVMVSDPKVTLNISIDQSVIVEKKKNRREEKECSFLSKDIDVDAKPLEIYHVEHGENYDPQTMMRGVEGGNDVAAEGCRLVTSTADEVMTAFRVTGKKKLNVIVGGTSRLRYLSLDLWPLVKPFGWKYTGHNSVGVKERDFGPREVGPNAGSINFVHLTPPAARYMQQYANRFKVCEEPDTFNVFILSFGIWTSSVNNRKQREISPHDFMNKKMKPKISALMQVLRKVCPDREQYRIIWVSNTATHAIGNERQAKLPQVSDPAEIVFGDSRSELSQSGPHMALLRDEYRERASLEGDAYVPQYEVTLPARGDFKDHIHANNNRSSGMVGSKMILTALRQLFENYKP